MIESTGLIMTDEIMTLKATINAAMKDAMRAREKERLSAIRLIQAEFKRIEVDERIEIDDARALAVLDKMTNCSTGKTNIMGSIPLFLKICLNSFRMI